MRAWMNAVFVTAYSVIALAIALLLPDFFAAVSEGRAVLVAAIFLILAAHGHLTVIRRLERAELDDELKRLRNRDDRTEREIEGLNEALDRQKKLVARELDRHEQSMAEQIKALTGPAESPRIAGRRAEGEKIVFPEDRADASSPEPPAAATPSPADRFRDAPRGPAPATRPETLPSLRGSIEQAVVRAAETEEIELYLQPIVHLRDRMVQFYEAFARIRDSQGNVFQPRQFLPVARDIGYTGAIDNLVLSHCIRIARRLGGQRPDLRLFYNIDSDSLDDDAFFSQFLDFMLENASLAGRLVFESSHDEMERRTDRQQRRLNELGEAGYVFSIDQVRAAALDFRALGKRHIRYVKVPARVEGGETPPRYFHQNLASRGVSLIIEDIDEDEDLIEALAVDGDYGQGHIFGRPRISRDSDSHLYDGRASSPQ